MLTVTEFAKIAGLSPSTIYGGYLHHFRDAGGVLCITEADAERVIFERMRKPVKKSRNRKIGFRVNDAEYNKIKKLAGGKDIADYCRRRSLED